MHIDQIIEEFRLTTVDIDCTQMVLAQNKQGGERYEGKGYIRQNDDGALIFKLYITNVENATAASYLEIKSNSHGRLHDEQRQYTLTAETTDGRTVYASNIYPAVSWDMSAANVAKLAVGQIPSLTAEIEFPPQVQHALDLFFFEEYNVPLHQMSDAEEYGEPISVLDTAKFEACNAEFTVKVRKGSGRTCFEIASESPLDPNFHLRVQEALQCITGKSAMYRAKVTCTPGKQMLELVSASRVSSRPHFCPPISPASSEYRTNGWKLFAAYLSYVLENTPCTYWNPLAYHLYNARESSANSVDAWAIGVSVALEALASLVSLDPDAEGEKKFAEFRKLVKDHISSLSEYEALAKRMDGLLNGLSDPRPQDILHALVPKGVVTKKYISAFSQLRNRHVHPKLKDLSKPDQKTQQKMLDRIHCVHVLLAQLTFHLVGYEGPYTDYGVTGFPPATYPLEAPTEDSPEV